MFYRYEIFGKHTSWRCGGLFKSINFVLEELSSCAEDYSNASSDYEILSRLVGELEYIINSPDLYEYGDVLFYYTEEGHRLAKENLENISKILQDYGFTLKETTKETLSNIIYEDEYQVATLV